jgi:carbonic anhydrase
MRLAICRKTKTDGLHESDLCEVFIMRLYTASLVLTVFFVACGSPSQRESKPDVETPAEPVTDEVHWGYEGEIGPEHWADLSPDFALCREGTEQSPIDLVGAVPIEGVDVERRLGEAVLTLDQRARVMDLVDNGHTIQVTTDVPMSLDVGGVHYELIQFHFHAPSEHTINGEYAALEIHFVHKSETGVLAVVGVLVEEGEHDPSWDPILNALPSEPGDARHIEGLDLDLGEFMPTQERYYRYVGSLTTPPCTEGVEWVVMADKERISPEQIAALASHLHDNNRPVQPLGDRQIGSVSK